MVVGCFIKNDLSYKTKSLLPVRTEKIFIVIFLEHLKPLIVS